jgi:NHL repeat
VRFICTAVAVDLWIAGGPSLLAQGQTVEYSFANFAGSLGGGPGSVDGSGKAARFRNSSGVAVDSDGNVYVADSGNYTIRKVTTNGVVTTVAGLAVGWGTADGTGSTAQFYGPTGVAVDRPSDVYVADTVNDTIRKVTPAGVVTTLAGMAGSSGSTDGTGSDTRFWNPTGVAVDSAGNVYVADSRNNTIRKVTSAGVVTTLAGDASVTNQFGNPAGGYADGTGSAARFNQPFGVAVDSSGNVYVADSVNNTIRKVTSAGVVTTMAGLAQFDANGNPMGGSTDGTRSAARFNNPTGVSVDSAGNVYVADEGNDTIRAVTPDGVVTTLAGLAGDPGSTVGTGSDARFNYPSSVAVDSLGNIYVADTLNNRISKGTPMPSLAIAVSGESFVLSWSATVTGFQVETATTLSAAAWQPITNAPSIWMNRYVLTNTWSDHMRFFRLRAIFVVFGKGYPATLPDLGGGMAKVSGTIAAPGSLSGSRSIDVRRAPLRASTAVSIGLAGTIVTRTAVAFGPTDDQANVLMTSAAKQALAGVIPDLKRFTFLPPCCRASG